MIKFIKDVFYCIKEGFITFWWFILLGVGFALIGTIILTFCMVMWKIATFLSEWIF